MNSPKPLDDSGRPEICPYDGEPCGGDCPAFNPCHAPLKAVEEVPHLTNAQVARLDSLRGDEPRGPALVRLAGLAGLDGADCHDEDGDRFLLRAFVDSKADNQPHRPYRTGGGDCDGEGS